MGSHRAQAEAFDLAQTDPSHPFGPFGPGCSGRLVEPPEVPHDEQGIHAVDPFQEKEHAVDGIRRRLLANPRGTARPGVLRLGIVRLLLLLRG